MPMTSFLLIDRSNQINRISVNEDDTIGDIMDNLFTDKNYTMQMLTKDKILILDRAEIIKNVLRSGIIEKGEVRYKLIHTKEYIDIYINQFTRNSLQIYDHKVRIYCTDDTTVDDIEKDLNEIYNFDVELGLYGFLENEKDSIFKLKGKDHVLFMKRCFSDRYFFQYQFNNCNEAITRLETIHEAYMYRLDYVEQKIIFKKAHQYLLKGTSLVKMKGKKIADSFYDMHEVSVSTQKYFAKYVLIIKSNQKKWLLCSFSETICQEMFQAILSCKSNNPMRKVDRVVRKRSSNNFRKSKSSNIDCVEQMLKDSKLDFSEKTKKNLDQSYRINKKRDLDKTSHKDRKVREEYEVENKDRKHREDNEEERKDKNYNEEDSKSIKEDHKNRRGVKKVRKSREATEADRKSRKFNEKDRKYIEEDSEDRKVRRDKKEARKSREAVKTDRKGRKVIEKDRTDDEEDSEDRKYKKHIDKERKVRRADEEDRKEKEHRIKRLGEKKQESLRKGRGFSFFQNLTSLSIFKKSPKK